MKHQSVKLLGLFLTTNIINAKPQKLVKLIDRLTANAKDETLIEINNILSRPDKLSFLIKQILKNEMLLSNVVSESYYHENGFHKIVLLSGKNFKLRLHHFGVAAKIPMENIHDHRWPFASSILTGQLTMDTFSASDIDKGEEAFYHFRYGSDKQSGSYSTDLIGRKFLNKIDTRIYNSGESYLMRTNELHRIKNTIGQESITLILTGKPVSKSCNLFAKKEIAEAEKRTIPYSSTELKMMLQTITEKIYPQLN